MITPPPSSPSPADGEAPDSPSPPATVNLILDALRRSAKKAGAPPADADSATMIAGRPLQEVVIAGYRLIRHLGRGGMANVYEALQISLRRQVALKILILDEEQREQGPRFLREARAMMQVRHPHVATIHDAGIVEGTHYLALEFIGGGDLGRCIDRDGPLAVAQAIHLMIGCCEGMAAIHDVGLIHRDVKPDNIFLTAAGVPKIGDFGLARRSSGADRMTVTGVAWGTPSYMAPEQIVGAADVDARADIYALGATFYTMLTGREPFTGPTAYMTTFKAMTEPFPDPRVVDPLIPAAVAAIIRMATEHERERRYQSVRSMREDLERVERQERLLHASAVGGPAPVPIRASAVPAAVRSAPAPPRRAPVKAGGSRSWGWRASIAVLVIAAVIWWWPQTNPAASSTVFPSWVSAGGHDVYGRWVEVAMGGATTRLRFRPPGRFLMGSPPDEAGRTASERQHEALVGAGFWIQETECDQEFYAAVMSGNPSRYVGLDLPVEQVSWHDAQEFCARLTERGIPARLPSEVEWEYACRAGSTGAYAVSAPENSALGWMARGALLEVWEKSGGDHGAAEAFSRDHQDDLAWRTHPVGRLMANAAGLFDLHGNVQEWCADRWDTASPPSVPPSYQSAASVGDWAVTRGGSWFHPPAMARSAARQAQPLGHRSELIGFRFVVSQTNTNAQ